MGASRSPFLLLSTQATSCSSTRCLLWSKWASSSMTPPSAAAFRRAAFPGMPTGRGSALGLPVVLAGVSEGGGGARSHEAGCSTAATCMAPRGRAKACSTSQNDRCTAALPSPSAAQLAQTASDGSANPLKTPCKEGWAGDHQSSSVATRQWTLHRACPGVAARAMRITTRELSLGLLAGCSDNHHHRHASASSIAGKLQAATRMRRRSTSGIAGHTARAAGLTNIFVLE